MLYHQSWSAAKKERATEAIAYIFFFLSKSFDKVQKQKCTFLSVCVCAKIVFFFAMFWCVGVVKCGNVVLR